MRIYATTADANYLRPLKILHASLRQHSAPFVLHVLAEGDDVLRWCDETGQDVVGWPVGAFLHRWPDMASLPGEPRTGNERACTWRWRFVQQLVEERGDPVLAVDSDLMFWSSPEAIFDEIGDAPMAVLPHGFPAAAAGLPGVTIESHGRYGRFNGGLVYLADPAAARRLSELTREWCYSAFRTRDGLVTFGDQGYLDEVADQFGGRVILNPAAAPGPWCVHAHALERGAPPRFAGRDLVAFHYHAFRLGQQLTHPCYEIRPWQADIIYPAYEEAWRRFDGQSAAAAI